MITIFRNPIIIASLIGLVQGGGKELAAQDADVHRIIGRVKTVEPEGRSVIVNRGSAVGVIPDSLCIVRAACDIEPVSSHMLGSAAIIEVYDDSMRAVLDITADVITEGDLCELYAYIPFAVGTCRAK